MPDLLFKHDVTIATDISQAITALSGEVLKGVPEKLAARLLRRPDVVLAEPGARGFAFAQANRLPDHVAALVSPPLDDQRIAEDEARAAKGAEARKIRTERLDREDAEERKADELRKVEERRQADAQRAKEAEEARRNK